MLARESIMGQLHRFSRVLSVDAASVRLSERAKSRPECIGERRELLSTARDKLNI